jgi:outer membrane protein TolC
MLLALLLPPLAQAVTLPDAWSAAERGGVETRLLAEQRTQAETLRAQAWALVQPKVVAGATYTVNEYPIVLDFASSLPPELASFIGDVEPTVVNKERYAAWNVSVIQPLFSGQALPLLRGAYRTVDASREEVRGQGLALRAGIARAFYGTAVAREAHAVAENAAANARTHATLAATAVDAGTAPPSARLEAQLAVARAERELLGAREARVAAETAFARLTGLPADSPLELPAARPLPWNDADAALAAARENRPALRAARLQAQAARLQHVASALDWLPTLDGRFTYNYSENTGFAPDPAMWMVVLDAKWTAWDGGFRLATQRKNASIARMADLAADRAAMDAEEQVRTLWEKHARALGGVEAVTREIALAEQHLTLAETGFSAGSVTFLQLEDARLGLRAARMAGLAQRMDRDLARLELLAAVGSDPVDAP